MNQRRKNSATPSNHQFRSMVGKLEFRAVGETSNQYEIAFSSEAPYSRYGVPEILTHSADAVDLSRFGEGSVGALLFAHGRDANFSRIPIGKVVRAWLDEPTRMCRAVIEFDDEDPECVRLQRKLEKGMLNGVSVGYHVGAWMQLKAGQSSPDGRFTGPADVAVRWTPIEISLEPVPADASVGFGRNINEEDPEMDEDERTLVTEPQKPAEPLPMAVPQEARSAVPSQDSSLLLEQERARSAEIGELCRSFGMEAGPYIRGGSSVDSVRAEILKKLQAEKSPLGLRAESTVQVTTDEQDKVRSAASDGMLLRCGVSVEKPVDGANEFRGMTLQSVAAECLMRSGVTNANRLGRDELFRRSMTADSAFVSVVSDVANRTVLAAQQLAPTTFQLWTSRGSQTDFRPTHIYEVSDGGALEEIPQNGEFREGRLSDRAVAVRKLITVGKMISFTRQLFINDDLGFVTRALTAYTLAFARGINQSVYEILRLNPAMLDGQNLFSSAHKNLCTGAVPGTAAFSEARRLMRQQTDMDGETKLNIAPAYVLTGSATETPIEALLASLADPSSSNSGVANVFRNRMQMIVDAELDVDSGTQPYYFAANPALTPTIEVSYLNGSEAPTVESEVAFDRLGMRFRVYGDRGITLLGYKGLIKNPGSNA